MLRTKNFVPFCIFLLILSCSIVKDSDITSLDQLTQLKLTSVEITQDLSGGSAQTQKAIATDSVYGTPVTATIDFNDKINGTIVKMNKIAWPVFTKTKILFRSKISSNGILIKNYFYQNGVPRSTQVIQNNQVMEWYSYYYTNTWRLTDIRSRVYSSVASAEPVIYRDSLIYNSNGYVTSMIRHYPSPTPPKSNVTLTFPYTTYSSKSGPNLGGVYVSYNGMQYTFGNCNCPNSSGNSCSGCDIQSNNTTSRYITQALQVSTALNQFRIEDVKNVNGSNSCGSNGGTNDYDNYYFHPLMILRGYFEHGDILFNIYAIDWVQPGAQINGSLPKNESVTFNFNYVR